MIDGIQIARLGGLVQRVSFGVECRRAGIVRLRLVGGNGEQSGGEDDDESDNNGRKSQMDAQKEDGNDGYGSPDGVFNATGRPKKPGGALTLSGVKFPHIPPAW